VPTLREVGEFEAIRLLTGDGAPRADVLVGPGDDAAVLRCEPGEDLVATTDAFVEGRHYLPEWLPPAERGARLAAANLSDLAAMAAQPRWALLSIGARPEHGMEALLAFQRGLAASLGAEGAVVVGGNLTAVEGAEWWSLTLLGAVAPGRAWTRAGARAGDLLAVTGWPGRAAAGLALSRLESPKAFRAEREEAWRPLLEAWLRPKARVAFALALAPAGAVTAAIDISDGLTADLAHLCDASGVGCELYPRSLPVDPPMERAAEALGLSIADLRYGPGDDYELLLAIDPGRRDACERAARESRTPLSFVGRFTERRGELTLVTADGARAPLDARGFDHFEDGINDREP
jgi:thiamine-monophosphate kinase